MAKITTLYAEGGDNTDVEAAPRAHHGDSQRQQALILAAFHLIAERGFEGLRTREVAARAGVNIATLHYYFATKEALIWGVRDYIGAQYMVLHAPGYRREGTPLERLRMEFADVRYYDASNRNSSPCLGIVSPACHRDPVSSVLDVSTILVRSMEADPQRRVRERVFRADLDPPPPRTSITSLSVALT